MNPHEQTNIEFSILAHERHELNLLLLASGTRNLHAINKAIDAYAVAAASAAVAIVRQVQADGDS